MKNCDVIANQWVVDRAWVLKFYLALLLLLLGSLNLNKTYIFSNVNFLDLPVGDDHHTVFFRKMWIR